jgi:hypothetical protein
MKPIRVKPRWKSFGLACLCSLLAFSHPLSLSAQGEQKADPGILEKTTLSGQWFLGFQHDASKNTNAFLLKRGYFTLRTELNEQLSVRYTQDIIIDREGEDAGNVEMRLKYLYLLWKMKSIEPLKYSFIEAGMVQRPWVEFIESNEPYRVQGTMFPERYGIVNSADFGVMASGLFGGMISQEYQKTVSSANPGKYGSYALGIYNGGGYHALERNLNKTIEARLTLRPMPAKLPGIQFSYGFINGIGNSIDFDPVFRSHMLLLTTESKRHRANILYTTGIGDFSGAFTDTLSGKSYHNTGLSLFGEFRIPKTPLALICRYDNFIVNQEDDVQRTAIIAGISYRFLKNKLLLDVERRNYAGKEATIYELVFEVAF